MRTSRSRRRGGEPERGEIRLLLTMFGRRHRLRRLRRLHRLDHLGGLSGFGTGVAAPPWSRRRGFYRRGRRGPGVLTILLAGLAVFALVRMMSASGRLNRTTAEKVVLGALIAAAAGLLLSLRRSHRGSWGA